MRKIAGASALRRFFVCENVVESPVPFGEFVRKLQNMAEIAEKLFKYSKDYDIPLSRSSFGAERGRKHEKAAIFCGCCGNSLFTFALRICPAEHHGRQGCAGFTVWNLWWKRDTGLHRSYDGAVSPGRSFCRSTV